MNIGPAANLYRVSCIISAVSNAYMSLLIAVVIDIPLMVGGGFVATLYGPLLAVIPEKLSDFFFVAFSSQTHMMWQLMPCSTVLQYMNLKKLGIRSHTKLFYAYIVTVVFQVNSWFHCLKYLPTKDYRKYLEDVIAQLHGAGKEDCRVYGVPLFSQNGEYDLMTQFYVDVFPSYFASYCLFSFSAVQIRAKLRSYGHIMSDKTERMQKHFFLTQIAQVLLPLVIISIPTTIIAIAAFIGVDLENFSFFFAYAFWISPSAQALLLFSFVMKSATGNSRKFTQTSVTKISTYS